MFKMFVISILTRVTMIMAIASVTISLIIKVIKKRQGNAGCQRAHFQLYWNKNVTSFVKRLIIRIQATSQQKPTDTKRKE